MFDVACEFLFGCENDTVEFCWYDANACLLDLSNRILWEDNIHLQHLNRILHELVKSIGVV